jgi:hypothetical protein
MKPRNGAFKRRGGFKTTIPVATVPRVVGEDVRNTTPLSRLPGIKRSLEKPPEHFTIERLWLTTDHIDCPASVDLPLVPGASIQLRWQCNLELCPLQ